MTRAAKARAARPWQSLNDPTSAHVARGFVSPRVEYGLAQS